MTQNYAPGHKSDLDSALGARPPQDSDVLASGSEYLRATYEQGKLNAGWDSIRDETGSFPLDGIGQHIYVDQEGTTSARKIGSYLRDVRNAYAAFEGKKTTKDTYVTAPHTIAPRLAHDFKFGIARPKNT